MDSKSKYPTLKARLPRDASPKNVRLGIKDIASLVGAVSTYRVSSPRPSMGVFFEMIASKKLLVFPRSKGFEEFLERELANYPDEWATNVLTILAYIKGGNSE